MDLLLLTYHGSIVCRRRGCDDIIHAGLRDLDADHQLITLRAFADGQPADAAACVALPDSALSFDTAHSPFLSGAVAAKRAGERTVQFSCGGMFLSALLVPVAVAFLSPRAETWETFFLLRPAEFDCLKALCDSALLPFDDGEGVERSDVRLADGFIAEIASRRLTLIDLLARLRPTYLLDLPGSGLYLLRPVPEAEAEVLLVDVAPELTSPPVADFAAFAAAPAAMLDLSAGRSAVVRPPVAISRDDEGLFVSRYFQGRTPPLGRQPTRCILRRESDRTVVLARYAEGVILGPEGTSTPWGFLNQMPPLPPYLRRCGEGLLIDRRALAKRTTRLEAKVACFYNGNLQNYYHWLVEAMLPLDILAGHLLPGFRLLMPRAIATLPHFDHLGMMRDLGFGDLPTLWCDEAVVQVDEVMWLEGREFVEDIPPDRVQAFNRRIRARLGEAGPPRRRLYVRRRQGRGIANEHAIAALAQRWGFTSVTLEDLSFVEQVRLFQSADFVIAPHGAGLSNLLFCAPGTRVIELMPDVETRPFFWLLSNKLDLVHGMLHCPGIDEPGQLVAFNRRLHVDPDRLAALYDLMR